MNHIKACNLHFFYNISFQTLTIDKEQNTSERVFDFSGICVLSTPQCCTREAKKKTNGYLILYHLYKPVVATLTDLQKHKSFSDANAKSL